MPQSRIWRNTLDRIRRSRPVGKGICIGQTWRLNWLSDAKHEHPICEPLRLQYFSDQPGLELPQYRAVGNGLRHYANVLYASREAKLGEQFSTNVDEVTKLLENYRENPSEENASTIASGLKWLAAIWCASEVSINSSSTVFKTQSFHPC